MQVCFNHLYQESIMLLLFLTDTKKNILREKINIKEIHSRHKWKYVGSSTIIKALSLVSKGSYQVLPSYWVVKNFPLPPVTDLNSSGNKDWTYAETRHGKLGSKMNTKKLNCPAAWVQWLLCIPAVIVYAFIIFFYHTFSYSSSATYNQGSKAYAL